MMQVPIAMLAAVAAMAWLQACASRTVVPAELQSQVDQTISFAQLAASPELYLGRVVVFGGEVLAARRLKEGTRIEVLHLPLNDRDVPVLDRHSSEGRFLAVQKEFLDPATIPPGTLITITGEVIGVKTLPLDEATYSYPTLEVRSVTVWPASEGKWRSPYQPYWGVNPYWRWRRWGPWWPYPYSPYWW